jgi:L-alanine-DL-glutamate epimerase-like enolase superfamily enzyme
MTDDSPLMRRDFVKLMAGGAALTFAAPVIKIENTAVYHLEAPVEHAVRTSFGTMTSRHLVLLELTDQLGNTGVGESWTNFPAWAPAERVAAFKTAFVPYLKGKEVADIPAFILEMTRAFRGPAVQSGTMGPLLAALCAVDMALIELAAKRRQVSIGKLLFDHPARRVRIYGSGINAPIPWKSIDHYLDCGVSLFKLKLGFNQEDDLGNLAELKKHLGAKAKIAVDINRNWTYQKAAEWLKRLEDFEVQWLEEPLRVEEEQRTRDLAALTRVPIAGGENILVEPGIDMAAVAAAPFHIIQPDMTKYCVAHDFLRLLPVASQVGKRIVPHFLGSAPGQAFSLHLAAGCTGENLAEWDINANPLHTNFFAEPFKIAGGAIEIPDRPGLGWTPRLTPKDRVA